MSGGGTGRVGIYLMKTLGEGEGSTHLPRHICAIVCVYNVCGEEEEEC